MPSDNNVDEFAIQIRLETDKIRTDLSKLSQQLSKSADDIASKFSDAFNSNKLQRDLAKNTDLIKTATLNIGRILTTGLGGIGATLGANFAIDFVKNMTSKAHTTVGFSQAYNTTPQNLQLLQEVYKRFGGTADEATSQVSQLYQNLNTLPISPELASTLTSLGLTDADRTDTSQLILKALSKIGNGGYSSQQRSNYLAGLGINGVTGYAATNNPSMLSQNIKSASQDLVSDEQQKQLEELDKRFQNVAQRWNNIQHSLLNTLLPAIESFTDIIEGILSPSHIPDIYRRKQAEQIKKNNQLNIQDKANVDYNETPWDMKSLTSKKSSAWDSVKNAIAQVETSGGLPNQIAKADNMGAYGTYGLRLSTAQDQLNYENNPLANNITSNDLMSNDHKTANEISGRYFERLNKAYGFEGAIKHYHGSTNPIENQMYLDKVKRSGYLMPNSVQKNQSAINHNQQTSFNIDNIHLPSVTNPTQFVSEMEMLRNTAFNSGRNQLA